MRPFAYARAESVGRAFSAVAIPGTAVLAGGTELLNWMRLGIAAPDRVVDITHLADLDRIESLPRGGLRIGALVRLNAAAADARVAAEWPVLRQAIHQSASAQIRNLATVGGNLLQKTRCAYFRSEDPMPCNRRDPGSGCSALEGLNDRHAIFGWTDACVATQPSDPAVALAALDAVVVAASPGGERRIPVRGFHMLPEERVDVDAVLKPGELITALELPGPAPRSAYVKVRERESYEYALVSAAVTVELDDADVIREARIALGSVAMRPWRLDVAEAALRGVSADAPQANAAVDLAMADARPLTRNSIQGEARSQCRAPRVADRRGDPGAAAMSIGVPLTRPDGRAKVTGEARFAADHRLDGMLHGVFVTATAPAGRVTAIDADAAQSIDGVACVLTHADMPRYGEAPDVLSAGAHLPMQDDEIRHEGQAVAIVLAETLEAAEHAASLVRVGVEAKPFTPHPSADLAGATPPRESPYTWFPTEIVKGDAAAAAAPVAHEAVYVQPSRDHNPIEPSATLADYRDGTLTLVDAVQHVHGVQAVLAPIFHLPLEQVRVRAPHTGGGFGCKGFIWPHQVLIAAAAIVTTRPVRIALTRAQMYGMVGYQPQMVQTVALASDDQGHLTALRHDAVNVTSVTDDWVEYAHRGLQERVRDADDEVDPTRPASPRRHPDRDASSD